jgi:hypothetical protein
MVAPAPSAAADYVVQQVNLPVPRFGTMKTKATVFELLKIEWYINPANVNDPSSIDFAFFATQQLRSNAETSSPSSFTTDMADPTSFGAHFRNTFLTTSGQLLLELPFVKDMTDENGNGLIVATDRLFIHTGGVGQATLGQTVAKVWYRLVNIGITEYVGIVQSQQG